MKPELAVKAARLTVVPCDTARDRYHVVGGADPHVVRKSMFRPLMCDCRAAQNGNRCTHVIAVEFFTARQEKETHGHPH